MFKNKKILIISSVIVLVAIASFFLLRKKETVEYTTEKVRRGTLVQTVNETGSVKAASEVDLSFLNAGRIAKIVAKVGDKIKKDDILAELDYVGLLIKEREARAALSIAEANLNKLLAGASKEEIAVYRTNVNEAQIAFLSSVKEADNTKKAAEESIVQAENNLSDLESKEDSNITIHEKAVEVAKNNLKNTEDTYGQSVENKKSSFFTAVESGINADTAALDAINSILTNQDSKDVLSVKNVSFLFGTKEKYDQAILLLETVRKSTVAVKATESETGMNRAASDLVVALNKTFDTLRSCFSALENTITSSSFVQSELDSAKTSVNTQLININNAISSLETADNNLKDARISYNVNVSSAEKSLTQAQTNLDSAILTARNSLNTAIISGDQQITIAQNRVSATREAWEAAKINLEKITAPARNEDINLSQAQIRQAQASLDSVKNQIESSIIKAPIDGTITAVNYEAGEQGAGKGAVVSMLGVNNFEIESLISESDIAKIKKDDNAEITLDALGDDIKFPGKVFFIEPAETEVQDVVYYKVKIKFAEDSDEYRRNSASVKSGMTANISIKTFKKENVLLMPMRAVISKTGQGKFVKILENNEVKEVLIKIGVLGDDGVAEAVEGVKEGDELVTAVKTK